MKKLSSYFNEKKISISLPLKDVALTFAISCFMFLNLEALASQTYFSPNSNVVFVQKKINAFLNATPEISLKAQYYNISKPVLETILLLQSNCGTSTSDGMFNYGRVLIHPELSVYPAFSKSKNGFILCTTRSRGVEATALSLSLLRNDSKNSISDEKWLNLIFGMNGDLQSLAQQADEIYQSRSGKSFEDLGLDFSKSDIIVLESTPVKEEQKTDIPAVQQKSQLAESIEKEKSDLIKANEAKEKELQEQQVNTQALKDTLLVKAEEKIITLEPTIEPPKSTPEPEPQPTILKNDPQPKSEPVVSTPEEIIFDDPKPSATKPIPTPQQQENKPTDPTSKNEVKTTEEIKKTESKSFESTSQTSANTNESTISNNSNTLNQNNTFTNQLQNTKSYGPTSKGTQLLGGSASFVRIDGNSILTINPNRGSFVANNFAIGINHLYIAKLDGDYRDFNALGPYLKFYLGNSQKGKVFGQISGGLAVEDLDFDYITFSYGLRAGYAVFINNSIALEFSGGYDKIIDDDGMFGGNIGFQIHFNKNDKLKNEVQAIAEYAPLPNLSSAELYSLGQTDAKQYYKGYKGAGTGALITSLVSPILGLIPAIACSSTRPKEINLQYPNPNFMQNSEYYKGYTEKAKKIKKKKVWTNWGIGLGANIVAIGILTLSK